jgi:hypothetical protein
MKNLFVVLVLLAALAIGLGFYLGWFHYSKGGGDEKANPTITVDQEKIKADTEKAKEQAEEAVKKAKEKVGGAPAKEQKEAPKP